MLAPFIGQKVWPAVLSLLLVFFLIFLDQLGYHALYQRLAYLSLLIAGLLAFIGGLWWIFWPRK
jgi:hypothetical protein